MGRRAVRIVSNLRNLDSVIAPGDGLAHESFAYSETWGDAWRLIRKAAGADLVIWNGDPKKFTLLCLLKFFPPLFRFKLVSIDLVLRTPRTTRARLVAAVRRFLMRRADRFIFYFKNLAGYERHYGIGPSRSVFIPFKVNDWEKIAARPRPTSGGEYVICVGRTMRDVKTFVAALGLAGCPGLLHQQRSELMAAHGTTLWEGELPANVELVVDDSNSHDVYIDYISRARIVVIPRYRGDIAPAGIATYLVAMALNKCVIASEGPGMDDVLNDEAVIVPPEDPAALAAQIKLLWHDDARRAEIAARGLAYAHSLEGEARLLTDILRAGLSLLKS